MRNALLFSSVVGAIAVGVACNSSYDSAATVDEDAGAGGGTVLPPTNGTNTGPAGSGLNTGLPCDVQAVLENRCIACHSGDVGPVALRDYDDLLAPSKADPTKSMAEMSLARMKANEMPPPPAEPPEEDEIKTFEDWVAAGTPKGEMCTDPPPDGGVMPEGGLPDGGDAGIVCTSGTTWTGGNAGSPLMRPGHACLACHQVQGGPNYRVAGTVYKTLREPDDCNGAGPPPQLRVIITDANNRTFDLPVNAAGNFFLRQQVRVPYRARVTDGTNTRTMQGSVTSGDCNSCHTTLGARGASGRIMAPAP
jgi:cytochrome c553